MSSQCCGRGSGGGGDGGGIITAGGNVATIDEHEVRAEVGDVHEPSVVAMRFSRVSRVTKPGGNGGGAGGGDGIGGRSGGSAGGGLHATGAEGMHCPPWLTHTETMPEVPTTE